MTDSLSIVDLKSTRKKTLISLGQKYPNEPMIGLLKHIDMMIDSMVGQTVESAISIAPDIVPRRVVYRSHYEDSGDKIAEASIALFSLELTEPAYGREILPHLRDAKIPLPEDDKKATLAITAAYSRRPDIFKRFPGSNPKATSRWHLQPLA